MFSLFVDSPSYKKVDDHFTIIEGVVHLYRHQDTQTQSRQATALYIISVPHHFDLQELSKLSGSHSSEIHISQSYLIISKTKITSFIMEFLNNESCQKMYSKINSKPFSKNHICYLLPLSSYSFTHSFNASELPSCPSCLERLDTSITTIVLRYQHQRSGASPLCSVCSYLRGRAATPAPDGLTLTPQPSETLSSSPTFDGQILCKDCYKSNEALNFHITPISIIENRDSVNRVQELWICMICGNIGCGRYHNSHAVKHYELTKHQYALELRNHFVWDYCSDSYVNRVHRADGLSFEICCSPQDNNDEELINTKIETVIVEYNRLLHNQLEEQYQYYESKINLLKSENNEIANKIQKASQRKSNLKDTFEKLEKEKKNLSKKIDKFKTKITKVNTETQFTKDLNLSLISDAKKYKQKLADEEAIQNEKVSKLLLEKEKQLDQLNRRLDQLMNELKKQ